MIVYKLVNNSNGKTYVGATKRPLKERIFRHSLGDGAVKLTNAIKKYGIDNFTVSVIEEFQDIEKMYERECFWIKTLDCINNGYNLHGGGNRPPSALGRKLSEETKQKMSKARKLKWESLSASEKYKIQKKRAKTLGADRLHLIALKTQETLRRRRTCH